MHENLGDAAQRQGGPGELGEEDGSTTGDAVERWTRNSVRRVEEHQPDRAEATQHTQTRNEGSFFVIIKIF